MEYEFSRPVPIDKIDRKGQSQTLDANETERAALADRFGLAGIHALTAKLDLMPHGDRYHITGILYATIEQESVASGQLFSKDVEQDIDAWYADRSKIASFETAKKSREGHAEDGHEIRSERDDPEPIYDGILDLGEVAAQFLGLALDSYPRAANEPFGDYIEVSAKDSKPNPFAALEQLKEKK